MNRVHECSECAKAFVYRKDLLRHLRKTCKGKRYDCPTCHREFMTKSLLQDHRKFCKPERSVCNKCNKSFSRKSDMLDHHRRFCKKNVTTNDEISARRDLKCDGCKKFFGSDKSLKFHKNNTCIVIRQSTQIEFVTCNICSKSFKHVAYLKKHQKMNCEAEKGKKHSYDVRMGGEIRRKQHELPKDVVESESAFKKAITNYDIVNEDSTTDIDAFLEDSRSKICEIIKYDLNSKNSIKMNLSLEILIENVLGETSPWAFRSTNVAIYLATPIDEILSEMFANIKKKFSERLLHGSGCKLLTIEKIMIRTSKNNPLRASSYLKLPEQISLKHAIINPMNLNDHECFKWSVCASQHRGEYGGNIENLKQYITRFVWTDVSFPSTFEDVKKFERNNKKVSINIFALDYEENVPQVFPVKVVDIEKEIHIDLLVLENGGNRHYTFVKQFDRLIGSQIVNHHGKKHLCKRCLSHHYTEQALKIHQTHCAKFPIAKVVLPETKEGKDGQLIKPIIDFKNFKHSSRVPIVIYADFESYLPKVQGCENSPKKSSTTVIQEHKPLSYGFYVVSSLPSEQLDDLPLDYQSFVGDDAAKHFMETLEDISKKVKKIYERIEPMNLTNQEWREFNEATVCYLCKKEFTKENVKVRDHCHITSKYRGAAHNNCNLNLQNPKFLPIFCHNMSRYDSKYIVLQLENTKGSINVVPNTEEQFITFSKTPENGIKLTFLDSLRFMSSSLDNLVKNLPKEKMKHLKKMFPDDKERELMSRKGVFCYDYLDDLTKLNEKCLPPKEQFKNTLNDEEISDEDYQHAQNVWKVFKCKTLGDYLAIYLKADVSLLSDVFEEFRAVCLEAYELDPCWYFTAPSLAWDAALKYTGVNLDLIQDLEIIEMVERGIRGGVAQCTKRYAKAKNKYIKEQLGSDPNYITYLDANNLYGWAMCHFLPTGNFEHFKNETGEKELNMEKLMALEKESSRGCIFEVDVEYPEYLHDRHSDFPFLPENKVPPGGIHPKLVTTLDSKEHYVIHYLALQQAIKYGLKITKVHSVVEFDQAPFLKSYIELNTEMRKKAKNSFEKDFFKLMNNAVYGKTMENVRKRMDMELVTNSTRLEKCIASIYFKDRTIYSENMCAVHFHKKKVVLNKPTYVGMAILDISKILMYDFHYGTMLPLYEDKCSLLYMDTDSFIYEIWTHDFYEDMKLFLHRLDTSDYPKDHPLYNENNKKVLGMFKDEANAQIVTQFVGLRAKMYCLVYGVEMIKKAKGVKTSALKKQITFDDYYRCLFFNEEKYTIYRSIRSFKHQLKTIQQNKLSISGHDDKRYIRDDKVSTYAHGHYRIQRDDIRGEPMDLDP